MIIRKATMEDLSSIQELNNKLFEYEYQNFDSNLAIGWPYTKKGLDYFTDAIKNQLVLVAQDENMIIGYLAGTLNVKPSYVLEPYAEIDNIYILESYQNLGVGSKLILEFKEYCFNHEIFEMKVTANAKNKNAILFYMKNHFEDFEITLKSKIEKNTVL